MQGSEDSKQKDEITCILLKARDVIAEKGWIKGAYYRSGWAIDRNGVCALGAVLVASGGEVYLRQGAMPPRTQHQRDAWDCLDREVEKGGKYPSVPHYNDHPNTTKEDILKLFDDAIDARIKEQEAGKV